MIRCLFFISEQFKSQGEVIHCPGEDNIRGDALSRNEITHFLQVCPGADQKANVHFLSVTNPVSGQTTRLDVVRLDHWKGKWAE